MLLDTTLVMRRMMCRQNMIHVLALVRISQNSISSDFDNQQTLDEMDKILESLQSWRDHRPEGEDSEGEDSEDEEYRAQRELYLQRQSQGLGEEDAPLTARHANEKTVRQNTRTGAHTCMRVHAFLCGDA